MPTPASVDDYFSALPEESRFALENLRQAIRVAAPGAIELISYQMPAFKYRGRLLVSYAAFKGHCSLFPMSKKVIADNAEELAPFASGKGTLRFLPDRPIPTGLVHTIVKARVKEIESRTGG
jgi:uncharacterized protein YdhG (YjbR/CyaY superfamily)